MGFNRSSVSYLPQQTTATAKIVIVGPLGIGKTTCVSAVSEIRPMRTEERMTHAGRLVDTLQGLEDKRTTTVSMDFGRLTLTGGIVLYLFGAPGQPRFAPFAKQLVTGALGGLVLADTRRLDESFASIDLLEEAGVPHAIAVNQFPDAPRHPHPAIREALSLDEGTPLVDIDARDRGQVTHALIALVQHMISNPRPAEATL